MKAGDKPESRRLDHTIAGIREAIDSGVSVRENPQVQDSGGDGWNQLFRDRFDELVLIPDEEHGNRNGRENRSDHGSEGKGRNRETTGSPLVRGDMPGQEAVPSSSQPETSLAESPPRATETPFREARQSAAERPLNEGEPPLTERQIRRVLRRWLEEELPPAVNRLVAEALARQADGNAQSGGQGSNDPDR